jgi:hypothetical protein
VPGPPFALRLTREIHGAAPPAKQHIGPGTNRRWPEQLEIGLGSKLQWCRAELVHGAFGTAIGSWVNAVAAQLIVKGLAWNLECLSGGPGISVIGGELTHDEAALECFHLFGQARAGRRLRRSDRPVAQPQHAPLGEARQLTHVSRPWVPQEETHGLRRRHRSYAAKPLCGLTAEMLVQVAFPRFHGQCYAAEAAAWNAATFCSGVM